MQVSKAEFLAIKAKAKSRKAKRKDNARFQAKVSGRALLPSIKALKNRLWDLNTLAVRKRDGDMCRSCELAPGYCQNHIVPQCEAPGLKFDLDNIFWGCKSCNFLEQKNRGHWQRFRFPEIFGAEFVGALWSKAKTPSQLRRPELNALIAEREAYLGITP